MDYFIKFKNITENANKYYKLIKSNNKIFKVGELDYNLYTYTLVVPKNKFEDDIYEQNHDLLKYLPRACSIIVKNNNTIDSIEGPTKFSGKTNIDEDPEDDQEEQIGKYTGIYDHNKIISWADSGDLEIVETEKANGKFAIFKIIFDGNQTLLVAGSKNNHLVLSYEQIDETISNHSNNDIIVSILLDIKTNWDKLNSKEILNLFVKGYSLAGELCDGQHFTDGDNTIRWFGFFKSGQTLDTIESLGLLNNIGLKTVEYTKIFNSQMNSSHLDSVFLASRCKNTEGSVLRCKNNKTNETILVKTKSVSYIVKRFMRQIILKGYKEIEKIRNRFIQAQKYHGLCTNASVRVTNQLIQFGFWMMNKKYPCTVLGVTKVNSVKGQLPNGFNTYWKEWMKLTGNTDIKINLNDFGNFSESDYLAKTELYSERKYSDPAIVIFFQGLQGSGKSTVGAELCTQLSNLGISTQYIEQDEFWGDTMACQGALYHAIASNSGPKVILVTRCNVNTTQYKRYIDVAQKLPCVISFVSPNNFGPLYLMVSLAGIINRSNTGDKLMVGRFEYPFSEVINFTVKNYREFDIVKNSKRFELFTNDEDLSIQANNSMESNISIENFVKLNLEKLNGLRNCIESISNNLINHIKNLIKGEISNIFVNSNPIFIGLAVNPIDKIFLTDFIDLYIGPGNFTVYNHHCTIGFFGGRTSIIIDSNTILPGQIVTAEIDGLVIRKSDNACAFKINKLICGNKEIKTTHVAHITGKIPSNEKPQCANSFIGLTNDNVEIHSLNKTLNLTCFWSF